MKKRALLLCLILCTLVMWGCNGGSYHYLQDADQIASIELVGIAAQDGEITVKKVLDPEQQEEFLEELSEIRFFTYYFGSEGAKTQGEGVRIHYQNGDWDLINGYLCHQSKGGVEFTVNKNCDQSALQKLVKKYL